MIKSHSLISSIFNSVSKNYDIANTLITFFYDKAWRKKAVKQLLKYNPNKVIDIATGTGEMIVIASGLNNEIEYVGVDISDGMLKIARKKLIKKRVKKFSLLLCNIEKNNFEENYFDGAMVAFGVRNFENFDEALKQIYRILKKNSPLVVLEAVKFNTKLNFFINLYLKYIVSFIGRLVTGNKAAYDYFYKSIADFYSADEMIRIFEKHNFKLIYKSSYFKIIGIFVFEK